MTRRFTVKVKKNWVWLWLRRCKISNNTVEMPHWCKAMDLPTETFKKWVKNYGKEIEKNMEVRDLETDSDNKTNR